MGTIIGTVVGTITTPVKAARGLELGLSRA